MSHPILQKHSALPAEAQLKLLTEEFCALAGTHGIQVSPHREIALERFRSLPPGKQREKLEAFAKYHTICLEAAEDGMSLRDSAQLIDRVVHRLALRPLERIYDSFGDGDVVEIYGTDFIQIFRNLEMLRLCSYTIADLCVYEWPELFRRPQSITNWLIEATTRMFTTEPPRTLDARSLPEHLLEEIFSPEKNQFIIRQKLATPLLDSGGKIAAFVATLNARPLAPGQNITPLSR